MNVKFELKGVSSLLMHADDVEQADLLREWRSHPDNKAISVPGDDRSPGWTWMTYLYNDGEHVAIPADNLMVCLRQAAAQIVMRRQKTFKEASQSGILPGSEFLTLKVRAKQIKMADLLALRGLTYGEQAAKVRDKFGFKLWAKRARVGQSKHIRVRPRFANWSVEGELEVILPEITTDVLATMFELAGRVGLCDWRPGCRTPGSFGRFSAKLSAA